MSGSSEENTLKTLKATCWWVLLVVLKSCFLVIEI